MGAGVIVSWAVPEDGSKSAVPAYVPVTVSVPTGALDAVQLARPESSGPDVVHKVRPPMEKVTAPVGFPPSDKTDVAVKVTDEPATAVVGRTEIAVVVGARFTTMVVVPEEAVNVLSPEYVPVTVLLPTGRAVEVQLPDPETRSPVVHKTVEPILNVTVPVGVPAPDTVAENMTGVAAVVVEGLAWTDVVEASPTSTAVLPVDGAYVESPVYCA